MATIRYSASDLKNLKGQALKDHYHSLIGKPAGLKNTTGLKTTDEIIDAVLQLYEEGAKPSEQLSEEMPKEERKKPGRKPKAKAQADAAVPVAVPSGPVETLAMESKELPLRNVEVVRIQVKPLQIAGTWYFLETKTNKVYAEGADKRPAHHVGCWNEESNTLEEIYE